MSRQISNELFEHLGGLKLSQLSCSSAEKLPEMVDYIDAVAWNFICGFYYKNPSVTNLEVAFLRQCNAAARYYESGRENLEKHFARQTKNWGDTRGLQSYFYSLEGFENCIGAVCKAFALENELRALFVPEKHPERRVFTTGDGSDLERVQKLNNLAKHWSSAQAREGNTAPFWITDAGLTSDDAELSFFELRNILAELNNSCHNKFVELPALARKRREEQKIESLGSEAK